MEFCGTFVLVPNWRIGERNERWPRLAVDQVVPILPTQGQLVDQRWRERRVEGEVGDLQMVDREVAFRQVHRAVALVIQAVVRLRGDGEVSAECLLLNV